ncbi:hypothetical protein [Mucilaginibacter psychrotolerans]|uniref:hypothetical protein n=1 Tax=Mucilaginibacter psychrotolerans TaxID=1524096 RepID=UPI00195AFD86|nr:hypothetical protein [Mucilaginibacter psychrotolerans]
MVDAYEHKYSSRNPVMLIKALVYHNDINFDEPIQMISVSYSWKWVKERLLLMTNNPEKTFSR